VLPVSCGEPARRKPSASGGIETMARVMAQKLTEAWGQNVIVDNRPGAEGNIGPFAPGAF